MVLLMRAIGPDVHPARATGLGVGATPAVRGVPVAVVGRVVEFYTVTCDPEVLPGAIMRKNVLSQRYLQRLDQGNISAEADTAAYGAFWNMAGDGRGRVDVG